MAAPVALRGVTKRFGDVVAVDAIDLDVRPGTLLTLLGPSGCGKTTTLRMVAGLERASEGRILIDDEDVTRLPANLRDVTMVFQSYALFPHMNVYENVAYGLQVARRPKDEIARRTDEALDMVGLQGLGTRATNALSGGQQQRVALARALVMEPKVLLFDEPLSNLDAKLRKRVRHEIRELQQDLGITSIYVTHDQEEALSISDEIVVMLEGGIEQRGTPFDLYTAPATRFVADFIGTANFLPGRKDDGHVVVGPYRFAHEQEGIANGPVTVMVRPEAVERGHDEGLPATVRTAEYLGAVTDCTFDTPVGVMAATIPGEGRLALREGEDVVLTFKPAGVHLLPEEEEPA
jgi:iron(III) transport system ATP-binding protein